MPIKADEKSFCCRCGLFVPINHFEYRIKMNNYVTSEFVICAECASLWNEEIKNHFVKWMTEGNKDGTKK